MTFVRQDDAGDGITVLTLDDGKLNALDAERFEAIDAAFDDAADASAVVVAGREGMFTAGLNTKVLEQLDQDGLKRLLRTFGRVVLRIWLEPRPVVAACTGHAIAAGTMLAMAADHAVAAEGDFRWGLTETRIGFALPEFAIVLARGNVGADRVDDLLLPGAVVGPAEAVAVGFADELVPPDEVRKRALAAARERLELPREAYAATKRRLRAAAADTVRERLDDDIAQILAARA